MKPYVARRDPLVLVMMALWLIFGAADPAAGHSTGIYYPKPWNVNALTPLVVPYSFGNLPSIGTNSATGEFASVEWGHQQWNALGQSLTFSTNGTESPVNYRPGCGQVPMDNWIYQRGIDGAGGVLAETVYCWTNATGRGHSFSITFDGSEDWYILSGDAPPGRIDLRSVAAHEFGHAAGQIPHWDDDEDPLSICVEGTAMETMCKFHYSGTERQRTLENHDRHTFTETY